MVNYRCSCLFWSVLVVLIFLFIILDGSIDLPPSAAPTPGPFCVRRERVVAAWRPFLAQNRREVDVLEAKTDVDSASTHPGSPPMIKRKKNKTKTKPSKKLHRDQNGTVIQLAIWYCQWSNGKVQLAILHLVSNNGFVELPISSSGSLSSVCCS